MDCARRESSIRRAIYPNRVKDGRLRLEDAQQEIARMEEIETLMRHASEHFTNTSELLEHIKKGVPNYA